jgi:putative endonuclease
MNKRELGSFGEEKAAEYLIKKGYEILKRNFRYARGEIDIIARNNDYLIFVEVKLRRTLNYGFPQAAVDSRKQQKIRRAAECFLKDYQGIEQIRFDVIAIQLKNGRGELQHFENAF